MRSTAFVVLGLAVALASGPAFAANEAIVEFTAMKSMGSDIAATPTPLSDEQLAAVEGGTHLRSVIAILRLAAQYQRVGGLPYIPQDLSIAQALQNVAGLVLQNSSAHSCVAGTC
jgi:hypothetical protein